MNGGSLIPAAVEAVGEPRGRWAFGFGSRFFVALAIGLVWLVPAWWWPNLVAAMFAWDAIVMAAWFYDLIRLPASSRFTAVREWEGAVSIGRTATAAVTIRNNSGTAIGIAVIDEIPSALRDQPPEFDLWIRGEGTGRETYTIRAKERGDITAGRLFFRYRSVLGLAERWAVANLAQTIRILPDVEVAREQALYLIRSRQVQMEKRRQRLRGKGREFESLREYRPGDEMRDICWTATARRHVPVTRTYQVERSQAVWIVVDAGRLLRASVNDAARGMVVSKLDYAVDAALSLAWVATQSGDRAGLVAYGRRIQQRMAPNRGAAHLRKMVDALAQVRGEPSEANHGLAARVVAKAQTRRSLIVWITDFAETATTPEVIEYAARMTARHLVVFAAVSQPDLYAVASAIPQSEEEMFRHAAALEVAERRELLLRSLRQKGVLALELTPGKLAAALVSEYLGVKERGLL